MHIPKTLAGAKILNPGVIRGFNPQPEPPKSKSAGLVNPGVIRGFNPQPEPPGAPGMLLPAVSKS